MLVLGIGIGSFYPTATTAGVTSVDESQASLAGGIVYMFQIAGGSIGLGLTTTVFSSFNPPFIDGFQAGFRLDAGIALVGLAVSVLFVGGSLLARRAAGGDLSERADRGPGRAATAAGCSGRGRRSGVSSPGPPISRSLPPRPISSSSPGPPISLSAPAPPVSTSSPSPPRIVAGTGTVRPSVTTSLPAPVLISKPAIGAASQSSSFGQLFGVRADGAADFERGRRFDFVGAAVGAQFDRDPVFAGAAGEHQVDRVFRRR